jgi:hypothetical protein
MAEQEGETMSFEDLAKHMSARDGGKLSGASDARQMMVEARRASRRPQRRSDLILGPLMLVCGISLIALTLGAMVLSAKGGGYIIVYYGAIISLIAGGARKLIRGIASLFRTRAPVIAIQPVSIDGHVYRQVAGPLTSPPPIRRVEPRPLAQVVAALAALSPVVRRNSLLVGELWIGVRTPHAVEPSNMVVEASDFRDVVHLATALVPLFGALAIDGKHLGWLVVDGTRSAAEVCSELVERHRRHVADAA